MGLRNEKGQVALFVALIFQVLFLFFAMVINVGLLIHHKINLQNSVDLAAYYGAMKQAENMNVVAHVNYQIRQSWKLLSWRYRAVGTAGEFYEHPFRKTPLPGGLRGNDDDTTIPNDAGTRSDFYDAPAFCATYVPFKPMPPNENTCKHTSTMSTINLFKAPGVIAGFIPTSSTMRSAALHLRSLAIEQCRIAGTFNYILLGSFIVSYNIDQGDRSQFIAQMSRSMSQSTEDFWDVDGDSVKEGIKKTLDNNLTIANREGLTKFEVYNSLGHERCNGMGVANTKPAKWLNRVELAPAFAYVDRKCGDGLVPVPKVMPDDGYKRGDTEHLPYYYQETSVPGHRETVINLTPFIGFQESPSPYNFSIGVEKNPWCMSYVGVKAEAVPRIPFSLGGVKLVARAFAKPFGGRIGPWYKSQWSPGAMESNSGERVDPLLPPKQADKSLMANPRDKTRAPNYSRFVGDRYGIKTKRFHYQFGRAIYSLDSRWRSLGDAAGMTQGNESLMDQAPSFAHWIPNLPFEFAEKNGTGDILAWAANGPSRMRDLELAAILPDNFDMAYYSIEPDFYHNYYTRLRDGFLRKAPGVKFDKAFRPDIGYRRGVGTINGINYEEFSIKDQYEVLKSPTVQDIDFGEKLTYVSQQWDELLTSWTDNDFLDYSLNTERLGKCTYPDPKSGEKLDPPTSGNCVAGGTSGYAVKMVSSDYLMEQDLELGGSGAGQGPLLNPPPEDF